MGTNYQQGYAFENRIVRKLNAQGGLAYRTAGSHSPVDITYWDSNGFSYLIQCKHSKKKDLDIKGLLCEDNTIKLKELTIDPITIKVLLIKQPRSRDVVQLCWNQVQLKWQLQNVFDLK